MTEPNRDDVAVMDNLASRKDDIRAAIEIVGVALLFLPPYGPDFSPIEQAFSKLMADRGTHITCRGRRQGVMSVCYAPLPV